MDVLLVSFSVGSGWCKLFLAQLPGVTVAPLFPGPKKKENQKKASRIDLGVVPKLLLFDG